MHINLSYPYIGTALQIKKNIYISITHDAHIILLQIDRYASLDHDFNIKYFLITPRTNITQITISVAVLTLAVPRCFSIYKIK